MKYQVEIVASEVMSEGFLKHRRFRLRHSLFEGGDSPELSRELVESYRAASVMLYDPDLDRVVLIEQFRVGALDNPQGCWIKEVVGGIVEGEESPESVAVREAVEEAGCEIYELLPVCELLVSPGYSTERIHLFCGLVDASAAGGVHGIDAEGEDIRVDVMDAEQAIASISGGMVTSTSTVIGLQWLAMNRAELRRRG